MSRNQGYSMLSVTGDAVLLEFLVDAEQISESGNQSGNVVFLDTNEAFIYNTAAARQYHNFNFQEQYQNLHHI